MFGEANVGFKIGLIIWICFASPESWKSRLSLNFILMFVSQFI